MNIIINLLLIIIILLLIYHLFYNIKEPLSKKFRKGMKKKFKKASKITKTVVKTASNPVKAFNSIKKIVEKKIVQPIKYTVDPPPPPPKPTRPYEYEFHSNLPKEYKKEVLTKLSGNFNEPKPLEEKFITEDGTHKCMFKYNPKVNDLKFVRTIINPEYNFDYKISSTECGENIPDDQCNKDTNYDMRSVFIEEKPNEYLNYELDKNKVFLHYNEEISGTIKLKTFKDYNNVPYEDVNPIYNTKYNVCQPSQGTFNIENGFDSNFPCSVLVCSSLSKEEKDDKVEISYENLNEKAKGYYDKILRYEHEGAIDKVLSSIGFNTWISLINQTQENNTKILDECKDYDDSKIILE